MDALRVPNQTGRGLVNLIAEIERRLTGSAPSDGLDADLASAVPHADTIVLALFDGVGAHQLDHPSAGELRVAAAGSLDAPFPSTTTVSLATLATAATPGRHGLLAHGLSVPELGTVLNTIHMRTVWGQDVEVDHDGFLPVRSVWARLAAAGVEPVTVQPGNFGASPLTRVLYRDARFEGYYSVEEAISVTLDVAAHPRRLVFLYVPFVDLAAHMHGQASPEYAGAMELVATIWMRLAMALPPSVALLGTADHGHVDIATGRRIRLTETEERGLLLAGDARALFVTGDPTPILDRLPGTWLPLAEAEGLWGPEPVERRFRDRLPDGIVFPDDGWAVFARYMNDRLVGYHGGLTREELEIPLLVRT